ncbi:unnamed protein product [Larinioides sclopetarius]|uniref:Uncharacterized protein n=1 Tax=Larinioides sclopetarius TaxID=280406 RepID=A0AAV1Z2P6_9ARAC
MWGLRTKVVSLSKQSLNGSAMKFLFANYTHFNESDFLTTSKAVDPKTGNVIEVPPKIKRLNNVYQSPLTFDASDDKMIFLHKILDWLDEWDKMKSTTGMFSKENHAALKQTVNGSKNFEICTNCSSEQASPHHILACLGLTKRDLADDPLTVLNFLRVYNVMDLV